MKSLTFLLCLMVTVIIGGGASAEPGVIIVGNCQVGSMIEYLENENSFNTAVTKVCETFAEAVDQAMIEDLEITNEQLLDAIDGFILDRDVGNYHPDGELLKALKRIKYKPTSGPEKAHFQARRINLKNRNQLYTKRHFAEKHIETWRAHRTQHRA